MFAKVKSGMEVRAGPSLPSSEVISAEKHCKTERPSKQNPHFNCVFS